MFWSEKWLEYGFYFICSKSKILIFKLLEPLPLNRKVITNDTLFVQNKRHDIHKNKITFEVSDISFVFFFKKKKVYEPKHTRVCLWLNGYIQIMNVWTFNFFLSLFFFCPLAFYN